MKVKQYFLPFLIGIAVGFLTVSGQKYLPGSLNNFANSGAVWLVPAFLVSFLGKHNCKNSIFSSVLTLLGCVFGYYGLEAVINGHSFFINIWTILWIVMAFVGGTIFGCGAYMANYGKGAWKYIGLNLLPAVFIAESVSKFLHFSDYSHLLGSMILSVVIGMILFFAINLKQAKKGQSAAALLLLILLGMALFEMLYYIPAYARG